LLKPGTTEAPGGDCADGPECCAKHEQGHEQRESRSALVECEGAVDK